MPVAGIPMLPIPGTWSVVLGIAQCSFHYLYGSVLHFVVHCTVHQYGSYLFIEGALGIPGWFWRVLGSHRHSWGEQLLFTGMKRVYIHTVLVPMNNSWNLFGPHVTCCSRQQYAYKVIIGSLRTIVIKCFVMPLFPVLEETVFLFLCICK